MAIQKSSLRDALVAMLREKRLKNGREFDSFINKPFSWVASRDKATEDGMVFWEDNKMYIVVDGEPTEMASGVDPGNVASGNHTAGNGSNGISIDSITWSGDVYSDHSLLAFTSDGNKEQNA